LWPKLAAHLNVLPSPLIMSSVIWCAAIATSVVYLSLGVKLLFDTCWPAFVGESNPEAILLPML
jgi:hypothetical protein